VGSHETALEAFIFLSPEEVAALTVGDTVRYFDAAVAEIERLQRRWNAHDKVLNECLARLRPVAPVGAEESKAPHRPNTKR
jgi:hypothetical protein